MSDKNYYESLDFISLDDLIKEIGEKKSVNILSTFTCSKNKDLQEFLNNPTKAIRLEQRSITRTYLYLSVEEEAIKVVAYFSITLKVLETDGLSGSLIKKLDGIDKKRKGIPCFLIAQLGKSSSCNYKIGQFLLDDAINTIQDANKIIGGRFIILDAINIDKVIDFYEKTPNAFILIDKKYKVRISLKMYYPLVS